MECCPVLIGEAPSRLGDRYYRIPLSGRPARVLCTLAGIPPQEEGSTYGRWTWALYERFECANLFERYAQATPWSVPRARERADALRDELAGRVVVCLGRRVHAAVWQASRLAVYGNAAGDAPEFHSFAPLRLAVGKPLAHVVAIPHPSGLNRALNDPAERERCGATLRAALELAA